MHRTSWCLVLAIAACVSSMGCTGESKRLPEDTTSIDDDASSDTSTSDLSDTSIGPDTTADTTAPLPFGASVGLSSGGGTASSGDRGLRLSIGTPPLGVASDGSHRLILSPIPPVR